MPEAIGHQYSHQFELTLDDETVQNIAAFYTQEMLEDWATYDPSGPAQIKNAMETREAIGVLYGMDGIPLDAITQNSLRRVFSGHCCRNAEAGIIKLMECRFCTPPS